MDSGIEKKRLDKLARVRENQRKSRARRQDHLQDLERKVLGLQKEMDRRDVEHRLAVQKLEAENKKLRDLHYVAGMPVNALEAYLRSVDNPVMAKKVAIPAVQRDVVARPQKAACLQPCSGDQGSSCEEALVRATPVINTAAIQEPEEEKADKRRDPEDERAQQSQDASPELTSFCACSPEEDLESLPLSERVLNTTFCAIAERLVHQYNARGIDVSEIQQKLRQGFFRSSSEEGCRVQNQILFQVLDEISGH